MEDSKIRKVLKDEVTWLLFLGGSVLSIMTFLSAISTDISLIKQRTETYQMNINIEVDDIKKNIQDLFLRVTSTENRTTRIETLLDK